VGKLIDIISRINTEAKTQFEYARNLRRDFHRNPELGFHEKRTSQIIVGELHSLGLETRTGIAQTGVVAIIEGARPGPILMLRFDMDALPIQEQTDADYASQNAGVMHACGHDGHLAIGLTVAKILSGIRTELPGRIMLVFQPAEEGLGGAPAMITEGVLENPHPDFALGVHLWNEKPLGWLGVTSGAVMTAGDIFKIVVTGSGGHGALPHLAVDPLLTATQIVVNLQSIVSRNVSPLQTAVLSVTTIHGGDAFNIIPAKVQLAGTIRTFDSQVRQLVHQRFREIVEGTAQLNGCQVEYELTSLTPPLFNDPDISSQIARVIALEMQDCKLDTDFRSLASEDMSFFLERIPGCFIFVGSANSDRGLDAPHHNPRFDFDENALAVAARVLCFSALRLLDDRLDSERG